MSIRERIADIKILQVHILQDYFSMVLTANFPDNSWKPLFSDEVQIGVKAHFRHNYFAAWNQLQLIGLENYTVCHMDTTIITAILGGPINGSFGCCKFNNINHFLDLIRDDRNREAHTTGNESDTKLVQWAYVSLHHLSSFITAVAKSRVRNVSDDVRNAYARRHQAEIDALSLKIENDYREVLKTREIEELRIREIEELRIREIEELRIREIEELRIREIEESEGLVTGGVPVYTLHEAIKIVLSERNDKTLHASELANVIYERRLYLQQDGEQAPSSQIRARCRKHPKLFEFISGGNIRLK